MVMQWFPSVMGVRIQAKFFRYFFMTTLPEIFVWNAFSLMDKCVLHHTYSPLSIFVSCSCSHDVLLFRPTEYRQRFL